MGSQKASLKWAVKGMYKGKLEHLFNVLLYLHTDKFIVISILT